MKYGVILPNLGALAHPHILTSLAHRAEELGFDGVFVSDHVILPTTPGSRYPYRSDGTFPLRPDENILEPVTTLSYLAAITTRVHLGFSVLVLPYRHPVLNAKMLGNLDVFSGGRLIVGVGVGWMEEEFVALGADYAHRGQVTDEHIMLMHNLWSRDEPEFAGEHYQLSGMTMYPKTHQRPHPPIWTGGISPSALRRAARLGDGWHGIRMGPEDIARVRGQIQNLRGESDEAFQRFDISLRVGLDIVHSDLPRSRLPMRGSADQVTNDIQAYRQAGLTYLVLEPRARDAAEFVGQMERLTRESLPQV